MTAKRFNNPNCADCNLFPRKHNIIATAAAAASALDPVHPSVHKYLQYLPVPRPSSSSANIAAVLGPTRTTAAAAPKYHTHSLHWVDPNRTDTTTMAWPFWIGLGGDRHSAIAMQPAMFIHHSYNSQSAKTGNVI